MKYFIIVFGLLLLAASSSSATPALINYQGVLTDSSDVPVNNPSQVMMFELFDVAIGGTPLWSEQQNITVIDGTFNVLLGSLQPLDPALFVGERWLQISVNSETLLPRRQFSSRGYAMRTGQTASMLPGSVAGDSLAAGLITGDHLANGSLNEQNFAPVCAEGEALVQTASGWVCQTIQRLAQNDLQRCYTGPSATLNVGQCREGVRRWESGAYTPCQGEVLPLAEVCSNNLDNDCDGTVNNGCP